MRESWLRLIRKHLEIRGVHHRGNQPLGVFLAGSFDRRVDSYAARLKAEHGKKTGFWSRIDG